MRFEELVNNYYGDLNDSDKVILNYIYENMYKVYHMGINELAKECAVSRSTVMRFAQKLHLNGFAELKTILKWDMMPQKENTKDIVNSICDGNSNVIEHFRDLDCSNICECLYHANRIFTYGTGNIQKTACNEFKRLFLSLGFIVNTISGESEFSKTIKLMNSQDVIFIISQRGNSLWLQSMCNQLQSRGIKIISLTFSGNNYLAKHSDYKLFMQPQQIVVHGKDSFKSVTMIYLIIEILCAKFLTYMDQHGQNID